MMRLIALLLVAGCSGVPVPSGFINTSATYVNTTDGSPIIYLIRHGEKDSRGCLSSDGQKRAKNLEELFKDGGKFSKPKSLYAYHYPLFTCQRCKQMLTPISQHLDKSIDFDYGSSPDTASDAMKKSLKDSKAQAERMLASAKKRNNQNQIRKAQRMVDSANAKIDSYNASENDAQEFKSGCPDGFRSKGSQTISGKRREVCCTPDGKVCMTADGIPL